MGELDQKSASYNVNVTWPGLYPVGLFCGSGLVSLPTAKGGR